MTGTEWVRPYEGPRQRNALDILRPVEEGEMVRPIIDRFWGIGVGGILGFSLYTYGNYILKRPVLSGIHRHIGAAAGLGTILHLIMEYRRSYYAERDAVFRHYVETHPDEFILPPRQKYSEVLLPWYPIR